MYLPIPKQRPRALVVVAVAAAVAVVALSATLGRPAFLDVVQPLQGEVVGARGVEVMVRFAEDADVAPDTFRVLLNGADMTDEFTTGSNGAYARLHTLLDGENLLRFEIFGHRWWLPGRLVEEAREVRFLVRQPQDLDRAQAPAARPRDFPRGSS